MQCGSNEHPGTLPWPLDAQPPPSCLHAPGRARDPAGLLQLRDVPPRGQPRAVHTLRQRTSIKQPAHAVSPAHLSATESRTAVEPLPLREAKLRRHKAASSAKKARERTRRTAGPAALFQRIAAQNARCGVLPWTARLVEALFPKMQPVADFSEMQCRLLQTAIVTCVRGGLPPVH
jgi:hypothetical protein